MSYISRDEGNVRCGKSIDSRLGCDCRREVWFRYLPVMLEGENESEILIEVVYFRSWDLNGFLSENLWVEWWNCFESNIGEEYILYTILSGLLNTCRGWFATAKAEIKKKWYIKSRQWSNSFFSSRELREVNKTKRVKEVENYLSDELCCFIGVYVVESVL